VAFSDIYGGFPVSAGGDGIRLLPGSGCKVEVALLQWNKFLRPFLHFVVSCPGTVDGSVRWGHWIWNSFSSSGCLLFWGLLLVCGEDLGVFFFLVGWFAWCFPLLAVALRFGWARGGERKVQFEDHDS